MGNVVQPARVLRKLAFPLPALVAVRNVVSCGPFSGWECRVRDCVATEKVPASQAPVVVTRASADGSGSHLQVWALHMGWA